MPRNLGDLIGAIDQGTSSTRFLVFQASTGDLITSHQIEVPNIYPQEEWVEQDPVLMIESVKQTMVEVIKKLRKIDMNPRDVKGIGLCNQRETTIIWDKVTGEPMYNAIVWLDNRTTGIVDQFLHTIPGRDINFHKPRTGLPLSTYFSAFKLRWLIENKPEIRDAIENGRAVFGTVDTWIMYNLLGVHKTDVTNASRTFLYDIDNLEWSEVMCKYFDVPMDILPKVQASGSVFGEINWHGEDGPFKGVPITAVIGDQSAALIGQKCLSVGSTKATFGTGCFILQNIGEGSISEVMEDVPKEARKSLVTTIGYQLKDQSVVYALEGSVAIAGAAITWMRDNMELISNYRDVEPLARSVPDSGGVFLIPAFQGLYAPYWDPNAAGLLIGLSGFTRKAHVIRATLEAVAFQTVDILSLMRRTSTGIMIDGGMACNNLFCEILSDYTGIEIIRPAEVEATALGAAMVAGHTLGLWNIESKGGADRQAEKDCNNNKPAQPQKHQISHRGSLMESFSVSMQLKNARYPIGSEVFVANIGEEKRTELINCWHQAIKRAMKWTKIDNSVE